MRRELGHAAPANARCLPHGSTQVTASWRPDQNALNFSRELDTRRPRRPMMRLASALILVSAFALPCHERADERVVYATLPLQPPVEKGQAVYLRGLPIGAVRAAAPAADSLRVTVAITRADAPLRRGDALRLKLAPVGGLVGVPV